MSEDAEKRSTLTPCFSWPRSPSRWPPRSSPIRSVRARSAGTPRSSTKLPWFALSDPAVTQMVTVGDMYSHRSGLPDHAGRPARGYRLRPAPGPGQASSATARPISNLLRVHQLRVHGRRRSGRRRARASPGRLSVGDVLFGPLGMTSTSSRFADYQARADRAVGHIHVDGSYAPRLCARPAGSSPRRRGQQFGERHDPKWLTMMLANGTYEGKRFVDPAALLPALTPQIVSSPRVRAGDALRLLRVRVQRRTRRRGRAGAQPFRGIRTGVRHQFPRCCRRPTSRSSH